MSTDFAPFPKLARLSREIIVTEKIDGTNAQVFITPTETDMAVYQNRTCTAEHDGKLYDILVASRTRYITPEDDNFGFAAWVRDAATELVKLGPGRHYGEWWGRGIQRGYGLQERRFSLFNTFRWLDDSVRPSCCHVVPVLWQGEFDTNIIEYHLWNLEEGSKAAPGFMNPEGIVVWHTAANIGFKKTLDNDAIPKSKVGS